MENFSAADWISLIAAMSALIGVVVQYIRTRDQGISALAEGYDKLTPHLNKRIDELVKKQAADEKEMKELTKRIVILEDRADRRSRGIAAAIEYMKTSRDAINNAIHVLEGLE